MTNTQDGDILQNGTKLLEGILQKDPHLFRGSWENQQQLSAFVKNLQMWMDLKTFKGCIDRALYVLDVFRDNEDYILDKELIGLLRRLRR